MRYEIVHPDLTSSEADIPAPQYKRAVIIAAIVAVTLGLLYLSIFPITAPSNTALSFGAGAEIPTTGHISARSTLASDPLWTNTTLKAQPRSVFPNISTWSEYTSTTGVCQAWVMEAGIPASVQVSDNDESTTTAYIATVFPSLSDQQLQAIKTSSQIRYQSAASGKTVESYQFKNPGSDVDIRVFGSARLVVVADVACESESNEAKALMADAFLHTVVSVKK
jgi:hypothetical protein